MNKAGAVKNMNELIDSAIEEELWWIDDTYQFEFNGEYYELMRNKSVIDYLTKAQLKKAAKKIIMTGNPKGGA